MGFVSAILLGLLASLHCAGMCGGLQAALNRPQALRKPIENQMHLLYMNLGRVTLYTLVGAVFGFIGAEVGTVLNLPDWSVWLRRFAAIMIIVIGFQLLFSFLISKGNCFCFFSRLGRILDLGEICISLFILFVFV